LEGTIKSAGQRMRKRGFAYARNVFDQEVATGQQRYYRQPHRLRLAANHALNRSLKQIDSFSRGRRQQI